MATETPKKDPKEGTNPEGKKDHPPHEERAAKKAHAAPPHEPGPAAEEAKHAHKPGEKHAPKEAAATQKKPAKAPPAKKGRDKKAAASERKAGAKKEEPLKVVEKAAPKYVPNAKPTLTPETRRGLALRSTIAARRPRFRRQQWYEYKRLADSGWRKPTGVDSAMRRHFGYEQSVVRIGFGGPKGVRGLHPSGFREVYVAHTGDLKGIDPKTQAARVAGGLGARSLKLLYAEAERLGVRILNRRRIE